MKPIKFSLYKKIEHAVQKFILICSILRQRLNLETNILKFCWHKNIAEKMTNTLLKNLLLGWHSAEVVFALSIEVLRVHGSYLETFSRPKSHQYVLLILCTLGLISAKLHTSAFFNAIISCVVAP